MALGDGMMYGVHGKYICLARYDQVHTEDKDRDDHDEDYLHDTEQRELSTRSTENYGGHDNDCVAGNDDYENAKAQSAHYHGQERDQNNDYNGSKREESDQNYENERRQNEDYITAEMADHLALEEEKGREIRYGRNENKIDGAENDQAESDHDNGKEGGEDICKENLYYEKEKERPEQFSFNSPERCDEDCTDSNLFGVNQLNSVIKKRFSFSLPKNVDFDFKSVNSEPLKARSEPTGEVVNDFDESFPRDRSIAKVSADVNSNLDEQPENCLITEKSTHREIMSDVPASSEDRDEIISANFSVKESSRKPNAPGNLSNAKICSKVPEVISSSEGRNTGNSASSYVPEQLVANSAMQSLKSYGGHDSLNSSSCLAYLGAYGNDSLNSTNNDSMMIEGNDNIITINKNANLEPSSDSSTTRLGKEDMPSQEPNQQEDTGKKKDGKEIQKGAPDASFGSWTCLCNLVQKVNI